MPIINIYELSEFCFCLNCKVAFKKGSAEIQGKHLTVIEFWDALKLGAQLGNLSIN